MIFGSSGDSRCEGRGTWAAGMVFAHCYLIGELLG